jgi:FixJ family two-component response regulator
VANLVIAIVDDDDAARMAVMALMRAKGFAVNGYASAEDFLQAEPNLSHCIITDIQMPGMTGIELKQRLVVENCRTPVIMITARVEQNVYQMALAAGAFCLLRKPFKANALIECVEKALAQQDDTRNESDV